MDLIKIKVNLPKNVYEILAIDMEAFGFLKSDGTANKNSFINHLIKNYVGVFATNENDAIKKVTGQVNIDEEAFGKITSLFFEERFKKEGNYSKDLQFIISKENLEIYEEIIAVHLKNRSISQYFREMLIMYTSYPMDKRQAIMFEPLIEKVRRVIKHNKKALVTLVDGEKKTIDFYDIAGTGEQIFNYVIGVETTSKNERVITSIRLHNLKTIIELPNQTIEITESEKEKLELMKYQGPVFPINKIQDVEVEFSERGLILWRVYIHDRPKPYKIENNHYFFKADLLHIAIYFYKFGTEAKIVSPNEVKTFMKDRFKEAYEMYSK